MSMNLEFKPYVRLAMYHTWLYDYVIDRVIFDHEIIYIDKGTMKIEFDDETVIVKEGDVVYIPPNVHHRITWYKDNCCQPHVHFDFNKDHLSLIIPVSMKRKEDMNDVELTYFREDFLLKNGIKLPHVIHSKCYTKIRGIIFDLIDAFTFNDPMRDLHLEAGLKQLIAYILSDFYGFTEDYVKTDTLSLLVRYMTENLQNNLTLKDFEMKTNLTSWTLNELFKKTYNTTPKKYYDKLRLKYAKNLIRHSFKSIKEISEILHFEEPQTFSRRFYKLDGRYPTEYKKAKVSKKSSF